MFYTNKKKLNEKKMCDSYPTQNTRQGLAMSALPAWRPIPRAVQFVAPNNANLYNNIVDQTPEQAMQLDRNRLMPSTWRSAESQSCGDVIDENSDFAKHAVTPSGYQAYLATSGSARFGMISRNPIGRLGVRNLLRSPGAVNVGVSEEIMWGDSELRRSLAEGYGCANF